MPKVQLVTDTDTTLAQAQDEAKAGKSPNPYEGLLSGTGLTPTERWANKSPLLQQCVDIYQKATGTTVPGPDERKVNSDGKSVYTDQAVTDFCGELFMFRDIAKKVGPNLTTANWQKTVNTLGPIALVPDKFASLCKGKYAAEDSFRLVCVRLEPRHQRRLEEGDPGQGRQRRQVRQGGELRNDRRQADLRGATRRGRYPGALLRWMARSSVPRYDEMTRGSSRIVGRETLGDDPTGLQAVDAGADREDQRKVVLDDDQRRIELLLHAEDQRAERLGLALRNPGGRLVEADDPRRDGEDRRQLDDAPGARRQLGDVAVGIASEAEEVDELARLRALLALGPDRRHPEQRAPERRRRRVPRARAAPVSRTVSSG